MADQTILGKSITGAKTLHDEAMRAMAAFRSGIYQEAKFIIASISGPTDLSTLTPETVDGSTPAKLFSPKDLKRAHLIIIRFNKDIIIRYDGGDPIELFAVEGGVTEESVLEVTKIEVTTLFTTTTIRVRLS